jgi:hypothetical protein
LVWLWGPAAVLLNKHPTLFLSMTILRQLL